MTAPGADSTGDLKEAASKNSKPVRACAVAANIKVKNRPVVMIFFAVLVLALVAADLGIKYWSFLHVAGSPVVINASDPLKTIIPHHAHQVVIPHVLDLWLTINTGAVFGSAKGAKPLFVAVSIMAVLVVLYLFLRSPSKAWVYHLALILVLSGALGNLYDRLVYSAVRDMFLIFPGVHLPFGLAWPGGNHNVYPWIFNFADVMLVVGVVVLGVLSWRYDTQQRTAVKAQD